MKPKLYVFLVILFGLIFLSCQTSKNVSSLDASLLDTTWSYQDDRHDWKYQVTFVKDGKMKRNHPNDKTPDNDSWEQKGSELIMNINDKYVVYTGNRVSKTQIKGTAKNINGVEWNWILTKE